MGPEIARNQLYQPLAEGIPEFIELIPAGPQVIGFDGRRWVNDAPDRIVADFNQRGRPLVIDWEHATETRAPNGLEAPAAGWIDRLEVRAGAVWGHLKEWTTRAKQQISHKEYRFLSPVFKFEKLSGRIVSLVSAGLTNSPNLPLTALNQRGLADATTQDPQVLAGYFLRYQAQQKAIGREITIGQAATEWAANRSASAIPATQDPQQLATRFLSYQQEQKAIGRNLSIAQVATELGF